MDSRTRNDFFNKDFFDKKTSIDLIISPDNDSFHKRLFLFGSEASLA